MNYARLPDMLPDLNANGVSGEDSRVAGAVAEASLAFVTGTGGRRMHSAIETRYFSGDGCGTLYVGDLLSITTLTVGDSVLVAGDDYTLWPRNAAAEGKPYRAIILNLNGQVGAFAPGVDNVEITGKFGYSDIRKPVIGAAAITGTVANGTGLTITASATVAALMGVGDTFWIEDEELGPIVSAPTTSIVVEARGINGTTAAAHSAKPISLRRYPADVERAVRADAARYLWRASQGYPEGSFREMWPAIAQCVASYTDPAAVL